MVFEVFEGSRSSQIEAIESDIAEMLATSSETFDVAVGALTRHVEPIEVATHLRSRDISINHVGRAIRRQLTGGAGASDRSDDVSLLLAYMSIAKDIERVGELAKDIWDLAAAGADMGDDPDLTIVIDVGTTVSSLIVETSHVFGDRDNAAALAILRQAERAVERYRTAMLAQLQGDDTAPAVSRALFYRYAARITAHLMNVLTAGEMPTDRLDYADEGGIDRY